MQLEVGTVFDGKVTGITKFGAFVEIPGGKTGMVHISEVAPTYVKEIRDFVTENQEVKVKVLSISEEGKIALSIKKAMDPALQQPQQPKNQKNFTQRQHQKNFTPRPPRESKEPRPIRPARPGGFEWQPPKQESASFEDMMSKFKQRSDEKISDLKRSSSLESKRGGYSRKGSQQK